MKKEDIKFLKELQHEMLTQDNDGQSQPIFWVVMDERKIYNDDDYDRQEIIFEGEIIGETLKDLYDFLIDYNEIKVLCDEDYDYIEIKDNNSTVTLFDIEECVSYLNNELDYDIYLDNYKMENFIVHNRIFLTKRECKEHIEVNKHHYDNPRPYRMTAWRSPQVEKLYDILLNTDWNNN